VKLDVSFAEHLRLIQADPAYAAEYRRDRAVLEQERANRRRRYLEAFKCPDTTGMAAPCKLNRDTDVNEIGVPDDCGVPVYVPCPTAKALDCEPHRRLAELQALHEREGARALGIPDSMLDVSFESIDATAVVRRATKYVLEELPQGICLVWAGGVGPGKTYAAVAALRAYGAGRFFYFPSLTGLLLDPARRQDALRAAKQKALVVFDDFGVEYLKDRGLIVTFLDELFWTREAHRFPTIVTTNLTPEQLKARLSDRIVDRLRGDWGRVYLVAGGSLRAKRRSAQC